VNTQLSSLFTKTIANLPINNNFKNYIINT